MAKKSAIKQAADLNNELATLENMKRELDMLIAGNGCLFFVPHEKQKYFIEDVFKSREVWAFCGNRSGKSEAGAFCLAAMASGVYPSSINVSDWVYRPESVFWACSASGEVQREVIQHKILRWLPKSMYKKPVMSAHGVIDYIPLTNGSRIVFKNYEQSVDKFTGADVDGIWFDEEPPHDIYKECLMRTIDRGGHIWGTLTPINGMSWVYNEIYEKAALRGIKVHNWDMDDNPYISDKEKSAILLGLTDEERLIRKSGKFVALHGLVYPMFDETKHVIEPFEIPSSWRRVIAVDPHLKKPTAMLWGAVAENDYKGVKRGDWVIYQELLKSGIIPDIVAAAEVMTGKHSIYARIGDPSLNVDTGNFSGMNVFNEFANQGFPLVPANKDLSSGIMVIRELLESNPPKLWIFSSCINLIWEFKHYVYKDVKGSSDYNEKITKVNDDFLDCLRYMVNTGIANSVLKGDRKKNLNEIYKFSSTGRIIGIKGIYDGRKTYIRDTV